MVGKGKKDLLLGAGTPGGSTKADSEPPQITELAKRSIRLIEKREKI